MTNFERIHNALTTAAEAGTFLSVSYDSPAGTAVLSPPAQAPSTVLANEISSQFGAPARNRRNPRLRERQEWDWELVLVFETEVLLEQVENARFLNLPILLPATATLRQVVIELDDVEYEHPPQQTPANGTSVTYRLVARVSPK